MAPALCLCVRRTSPSRGCRRRRRRPWTFTPRSPSRCFPSPAPRVAPCSRSCGSRIPAHRSTTLLDALGVPASSSSRSRRGSIRARTPRSLAGRLRRASDVVAWFDPRYPALLNCAAIRRRCSGSRHGRGPRAPAVAIVGSRAATTYALEVGARLAAELAERGVVVTSGLARGRRFGGPQGLPRRRRADDRGARVGARQRLPAGARRSGANDCRKGVVVSELGPARRRCRRTFRFGTGSSAGSPWRLSSSKPPRRADRSSPPGAPWNRGGTSWRSPAAS